MPDIQNTRITLAIHCDYRGIDTIGRNHLLFWNRDIRCRESNGASNLVAVHYLAM